MNSKEKRQRSLQKNQEPALASNINTNLEATAENRALENTYQRVTESMQENAKTDEHDLSGREKWVSVVETAFSDFDPARS